MTLCQECIGTIPVIWYLQTTPSFYKLQMLRLMLISVISVTLNLNPADIKPPEDFHATCIVLKLLINCIKMSFGGFFGDKLGVRPRGLAGSDPLNTNCVFYLTCFS